MASITYDNKDKNNLDGVHNKWTDSNANEVKSVVNGKQDQLDSGKNYPVDCGDHDFSGGSFPTGGGSGAAGAIIRANYWRVTVGGTAPGGYPVYAGQRIQANKNSPTNTVADWDILNS